jgi:acetoin utilization protein AcuB
MSHTHRRQEAIERLLHATHAARADPAVTIPALSTHSVGAFMTPSAHSIGRDQSLEKAHAMMRKYGIRHLPVLEGGKLAGMLSQRDLYFVESLGGVDVQSVKVEEAMSPETYCVPPTTPVEEVAMEMAEHRYGCAVVMDGPRVAGVFTTTDALRALAELLRKSTRAIRS